MKIITFIRSLVSHLIKGSPKSTQNLIDQRFAICNSCESYDQIYHQCVICGCNINKQKIFMNKLAWKDQKCPLNKW